MSGRHLNLLVLSHVLLVPITAQGEGISKKKLLIQYPPPPPSDQLVDIFSDVK